MSEETVNPVVPATSEVTNASAHLSLTSEQLKQRLDETREKTAKDIREATLKEFGFASVADGKKSLAALTALQQSQMTEQEKRDARIKELEPKADAAEKAQARYAAAVDREFSRLPDNVKEAIDEQAKGDPEAREMLMRMFEKVGATVSATADASATTATADKTVAAKPATAAATSPAPKGAASQSKFDEWDTIRKSKPAAAGAFYQVHKLEIERTRPSA